MYSLMSNPDIFFHNFSLTFDTVLLPTMWNKTELSIRINERVNLHRHPVLYGAAIYALLLIIVGTIGNEMCYLE